MDVNFQKVESTNNHKTEERIMNKVKLDLFLLKSKEDLISVKQFFSESIKNWFNMDGSPKSEYFHVRECPLCGESKSIEAFKIDNFSYHRCQSCSSLYTKPHLREGVLDALYSDGTYQFYRDNLVKKGSKLRKGVLEQRKYEQINSLFNNDRVSLLDVGCGGGTFLEVCKEKGWDVEGIDPSPESSSACEVKIHHGDFNQKNFDKKFDVITLWGVLEHMSQPILAVSKASKILNPGGLLVFEVPSADCFISYYLQKTHFYPTRYIESGRHNIFFSKTIISKIAKEHGLEVILIESNGLDIQTIFLEEFSPEITEKVINIQDILNDLLLGDHYRVFLRKKDGLID
jgi:2-polyprenyl-3-methyl-5-hydroxy-6-metoxy-1,4-benzoquinol methylase